MNLLIRPRANHMSDLLLVEHLSDPKIYLKIVESTLSSLVFFSNFRFASIVWIYDCNQSYKTFWQLLFHTFSDVGSPSANKAKWNGKWYITSLWCNIQVEWKKDVFWCIFLKCEGYWKLFKKDIKKHMFALRTNMPFNLFNVACKFIFNFTFNL